MATKSEKFEDYVKPNSVFMFSKSYCPYCTQAKELLNSLGVKFGVVEVDVEKGFPSGVVSQAQKASGVSTFPNIFVGSTPIGGCSDLKAANSSGKLKKLLDEEKIAHK